MGRGVPARAAFSVERVLFCELGLASDESPLDENSYVFSEASSTWLPFLLNSRRSRARMSVAAATASCATVEDLLGAHENHQQALDRPPKAPPQPPQHTSSRFSRVPSAAPAVSRPITNSLHSTVQEQSTRKQHTELLSTPFSFTATQQRESSSHPILTLACSRSYWPLAAASFFLRAILRILTLIPYLHGTASHRRRELPPAARCALNAQVTTARPGHG
eukprot:3939649-Rhodomonas_salina.1